MNKTDILTDIERNPIFYLATERDHQPRVRVMTIEKATPEGIIFGTDVYKDVYKELRDNPKVEMCFFYEGKQVRISGVVEVYDNINLKKEMVKKKPFLQPLIEKDGYDAMVLYHVKKAKAYVWTPESGGEPKVYVDL